MKRLFMRRVGMRLSRSSERKWLVLNKALTMFVAALGILSSIPGSEAMSAYRWKHRPVFVFAPTPGDPALAEQRRIFAAQRAGLIERDVAIIWVVEDRVRAEHGPSPGSSASELRKRFGVDRSAFQVFLVGKDGGTKLAQSQPLTAATLFGTIDAMPMRRDEIRSRQ